MLAVGLLVLWLGLLSFHAALADHPVSTGMVRRPGLLLGLQLAGHGVFGFKQVWTGPLAIFCSCRSESSPVLATHTFGSVLARLPGRKRAAGRTCCTYQYVKLLACILALNGARACSLWARCSYPCTWKPFSVPATTTTSAHI